MRHPGYLHSDGMMRKTRKGECSRLGRLSSSQETNPNVKKLQSRYKHYKFAEFDASQTKAQFSFHFCHSAAQNASRNERWRFPRILLVQTQSIVKNHAMEWLWRKCRIYVKTPSSFRCNNQQSQIKQKPKSLNANSRLWAECFSLNGLDRHIHNVIAHIAVFFWNNLNEWQRVIYTNTESAMYDLLDQTAIINFHPRAHATRWTLKMCARLRAGQTIYKCLWVELKVLSDVMTHVGFK